MTRRGLRTKSGLTAHRLMKLIGEGPLLVRRALLDAAAAGSPFAIQKVCDFALTIQGMIES